MNIITKSNKSLRYVVGVFGLGFAAWLSSACIVVSEKPADSAVPTTPPPPPPDAGQADATPSDAQSDQNSDAGTADAGPHRKPPRPASPGSKKESDAGTDSGT